MKTFKINGDDTQIQEVETIYQAKSILNTLKIGVDNTYVIPIQNYNQPLSYIHVYFADHTGNDVAYYTPCLHNLYVFKVPRPGSKINKLQLESYDPSQTVAISSI